MKTCFKKYWDKLYFSFIDYIFRRTTLNFILYTLITVSLLEAGTLAATQELATFLNELKVKFPSGVLYYVIRIIEVFFVKGSLLVLVISICFALLVWYLKRTEISKAHSGEHFKLIQKGLEDKLKRANETLQESITEQEREKKKKAEYQRFLQKINFTLQEKNISKAEILSKFNKKLRIIVVHKSAEDSKNYLIRDQFYPHIGAFYIHGGTCIVPPNKIDQSHSDKEILNWFEAELRKFIPDNYKFNFALVSVVDLKSTVTLNQEMHPKSKYRTTYLDGITIDQVLTFRELESFLYSEKNISSKDIIDLPSLTFLADSDSTSLKNIKILEDKNKDIIDSLKNHLRIEKIKTTDIANVKISDLKTVLDQYMKDTQSLAENIFSNAKFWKDYFENKI